MAKNKKWTKEEIEFLRENYLEFGNVELSKILKRTQGSISQRLGMLDLGRSKEWVSKRMKENNPMFNKKIAKKVGLTKKKKYASGENIHPMLGKKRQDTSKRLKENNPMNIYEDKRKKKEYNKKYYKEHKKQIRIQGKEYRQRPEVKEKRQNYEKEYREKNEKRLKIYHKKKRKRNKEKIKEQKAKYYQENKNNPKFKERKRKYGRKYEKNRRKNDKNFVIKKRLRRLILSMFERYINTGKIISSRKYKVDYKAIIGHLKPFPEDISKYHIDHIRPLCSFNFINPDGSTNLKEVRKAFLPENHQWLTIHENLSKGGRF